MIIKLKAIILGILFLNFGLFYPTVERATKTYDIIIRNGKIIDGTGNPWFYADVGINRDKIETIGDLSKAMAKKSINAKELIVCPGFIDMHTHCDYDLGNPKCKSNLNYLIQGVTTVVTGNCGESISLEVLKTKKKWEKQGIGTHVIFLVGHGNIRRQVMGTVPRKATSEEIEKMKILVRKTMDEGAWGMSTALEYIPGRYADTNEVIALIKIVREYQGVYTTHMRNEADRIIEAINETLRIARETGVRSDISHFKLTGKNNWGIMKQAVQTIEKARAQGIYIVADQYPYIQSAPFGLISTFVEIPETLKSLAKLRGKINQNHVWEAGWESVLAAYHKELIKALKDKKKQNMIKQLTLKGLPNNPSPVAMWGWHDFSFLVAVKNRHLVGKNFIELCDKDDDDIFNKLVPIIIDEPDILYGGGSQSSDNLKLALKQPWLMISSDGGANPITPTDAKPIRGHPREFGSQTKVLRKFVRQEKLLTLEDAMRKMTSLPASFLQLKKRGLLREGFKADIVVFDPDIVKDEATYADSKQYSSGIFYVLLDGKVGVEKGKYIGALHGKVLLLSDNK